MSAIIKMTRLKKKLESYSRIVIYGAGYLAKIIYKELRDNDISVDYCVVSNKSISDDKFEDLDKFEFHDHYSDMQESNVITLIAVTELYEKEIEVALLEHNVKNYLFVTKYSRECNSFKKYRDKTDIEYLTEIAEWYIDDRQLSWGEADRIEDDLKQRVEHRVCEKHNIMFAIGNVSPRVVKIAKALRNESRKVNVVFFPKVNANNAFIGKLLEVVDSYVWCTTLEELMFYLTTSVAEVVHIFSHAAVSYVSCILLNQKKLFPKFIFEQYDIVNEMYIKSCFLEDVFKEERYCLEHAEALCCRGYEQEYLIEKKKYQIKGKIIKFLDYCQDDTDDVGIRKQNMNKKSDNTLSICYAGGIATEREWPNASYACFLEFADLCRKNKCHFHVYPSTWNEKRFVDYLELDTKNEFFHFHRPVEYALLKEELAQYDYGVHPVKGDYIKKDINGYYTKEKLEYAVTNHFFDYLDAELPIIAAMPTKFVKLFEGEGVLLNWSIEQIDFEELRIRREELKQAIPRMREKYSISKKVCELVAFYDSL